MIATNHLAAFTALLPITLLVACWPCAYGPSYIEEVNQTFSPGEAVEIALPLDGGTEGAGEFAYWNSSDLPEGLDAEIVGEELWVYGALEEPGSYDFVIVLEEEEGEACAPWARYDFALTIEAPSSCAYGPSYIEDVSRTFSTEEGVDFTLPLDGGIEGSGEFAYWQSSDIPEGLDVEIVGEDLRVYGTLEEPGNYHFVIVLQEEEGEACAPWARYDLDLMIEAP